MTEQAIAVAAAQPLAALQQDAQAQLALTELFPDLRLAADAALRDIFVGLRAATPANAGIAR